MKTAKAQKLQDHLDVLMRRIGWILIPFITVSVLMVVLVFRLPDIYRSETLILIEPQKIPEAYVKSPLSIETTERLNALREQIFSRTNLLGIIKQFNLYEDAYPRLNNEKKIAYMQKNIRSKTEHERVPSFRISFDHKDPVIAQKVTARLAALFIEYDAKTREQRVIGTSDFLDNELSTIERDLKIYEDKIAQFKQDRYYELPEQLSVNLHTLDRLQDQLKSNTEAIDRAEAQRLLIERELAETPPRIEREAMTSYGPSPRSSESEYEAKKLQLEKMKSSYTENHPDVIALKNLLEQMEKEKDSHGQREDGEPRPVRSVSEPNPIYRKLVDQLNSIKTEIKVRKDERNWILGQINNYSRRIANVPKREQEIASVVRIYTDLKQQYESLLKKRQEAKLATNLESRQKGEQFKVQDPASLPENPVKPKRALLILMGILGGIGLSLGLAYTVELVAEEIRNEAEIGDLLNLPVLGEIPDIVTEVDTKRGKLRAVALACLSLLLVAGYAGLLALLLSENTISRAVVGYASTFLL